MFKKKLQFLSSDAWIFLSIVGAAGEELAPLNEIIHVADFINRAVPDDYELEGGLTRLLQAGLIRQEKSQFGLTAEGLELAARCRRKSWHALDQWRHLEEIFNTEKFVKTCDSAFSFKSGEGEEARNAYRRWFEKGLKKLEEKEEDKG